MQYEKKGDRTLGEGDRYKELFEEFTHHNCTPSAIPQSSCCWLDCQNEAIYFDHCSLGFCFFHLPFEEIWR